MCIIKGSRHHVLKLVCGPHTIKLFSKRKLQMLCHLQWEKLRASHLVTVPAASKLPEMLSIYLIRNLLVKNFQCLPIIDI